MNFYQMKKQAKQEAAKARLAILESNSINDALDLLSSCRRSLEAAAAMAKTMKTRQWFQDWAFNIFAATSKSPRFMVETLDAVLSL